MHPDEVRMFRTMSAIELVRADTMSDFARQFVAAATVALGQFREIEVPPDLLFAIGALVAQAPETRDHSVVTTNAATQKKAPRKIMCPASQ